MQFPTKLLKDGKITVPKNIREYLGVNEGDSIIVDVVTPDHVSKLKGNLEDKWKGKPQTGRSDL